MPPSKHSSSSPLRLPVRVSNRSSLLKKLERETRWLEVEGEEGSIRHRNPPPTLSSIADISSIHNPNYINHHHRQGGAGDGRLVSDPSFEEDDLSLPTFSVKGPMPLHRTVVGPLTNNNNNSRGRGPSSHLSIQQSTTTPPQKNSNASQKKPGTTFHRDQKHSIGKLLLPIGQRPSSLSCKPPPPEGRGRAGSLAPPLPLHPPAHHQSASGSLSLSMMKKGQSPPPHPTSSSTVDGPPTTHADIYVDEAGVVRRGDNAVAWLKSVQKSHFAGAYSSEYETSSATYIPGVDVPPSAIFTALTETRRQGSPERAHKLAQRMVQDQFSPHFTSSSQKSRLKVESDDLKKPVSKVAAHHQQQHATSSTSANKYNTCPDHYVLEALRKHFTPSKAPPALPSTSPVVGGTTTSVDDGVGEGGGGGVDADAVTVVETAGDTHHLFPLSALPPSYRSPFVPRALRPARSASIDGVSSPSPAAHTTTFAQTTTNSVGTPTPQASRGFRGFASTATSPQRNLNSMEFPQNSHASVALPEWVDPSGPLPLEDGGGYEDEDVPLRKPPPKALRLPHGMSMQLEQRRNNHSTQTSNKAVDGVSSSNQQLLLTPSPSAAHHTTTTTTTSIDSPPHHRTPLEICYETICGRIDAQLSQQQLEKKAAAGDLEIAVGLLVTMKHPISNASKRQRPDINGKFPLATKRHLRELLRWAIGATIVRFRARTEKRILGAKKHLQALVYEKVEQERVTWYRRRVEAAIAFFKSIGEAATAASQQQHTAGSGSPVGLSLALPGSTSPASSLSPQLRPLLGRSPPSSPKSKRNARRPITQVQTQRAPPSVIRCEMFGLDRDAYCKVRDTYRFICGDTSTYNKVTGINISSNHHNNTTNNITSHSSYVLSLKELQTLAATGGVEFDVNLFRRIDLDRGGYLELDEILHVIYPGVPLKVLRSQIKEWEYVDSGGGGGQTGNTDGGDKSPEQHSPGNNSYLGDHHHHPHQSAASVLSPKDQATIRVLFRAADLGEKGYLTREDAARAFLTRGQYTEMYGYSGDESLMMGDAMAVKRAKEAAARMKKTMKHVHAPPMFIPGSFAPANIALLKEQERRSSSISSSAVNRTTTNRKDSEVCGGNDSTTSSLSPSRLPLPTIIDANADGEDADAKEAEHSEADGNDDDDDDITRLHLNDRYWFDAYFPNRDTSLMYLPEFMEAIKFCFPPFKKVIFYENVPAHVRLPNPIPQSVLDMQARMSSSAKINPNGDDEEDGEAS